MAGSTIDLYSPPFWVALAVAAAVLTPLTDPKARRLGFALINLGFLAFFLRDGLIAVLAGLVAAWWALRRLADRRSAPVIYLAGGGAIASLFVIHKLPISDTGLGRAHPLLSLIGFSYLALRLVDLARAVGDGRHPAPNFFALINYLVPFHMLAAGPIQSYDDFATQPPVPAPLGPAQALAAVERIVRGMFKKYVLASFLQQLFLTGFRAGGAYTLLEVQVHAFWVYLDFSAYSDIAVGAGRLIGVATPENFNRPLLARNIIEFWERWHMSLSQFIRRHIFIPTQTALLRRSDGRAPLRNASIAFGVSFLLCGLWHGLQPRWVVWGLFQAGGLIVCNLYKHALLKRLGRKGVSAYLANPWIKLGAVAVAFEFSAVAMAIGAFPCEEIAWWMRNSLLEWSPGSPG